MTFVLGDVEGSVRLWEAEPEAMAGASVRLDALISDLVEAHGGARPTEQGEGDSFVAVFSLAHEAVAFSLALQQALEREPWANSLPLRVRVAVHTGPAHLRGDDNYMGPTVNRCARVRALVHGGQVVVSGATAALVADEIAGDVSLVDLGLHALRDLDRPERVFQLVHPDLPRGFPPLRDEGEAPRLPSVLTTFVAREAEMAALAEELHASRLVTLTGAGGSGKTRLALETARQEVPRFPDGVAWADAAPIADGALLVSCVAGGLGIREIATEPLLDTVVREVGDRASLLVIDNCEHVIDEAARVVDRLLGGCPRLRVLATSREPLGVHGEAAIRVPSLEEQAAVELFVDRARSATPEFEMTAESEAAVRDVCRRLDGIPLAIELAAARVRVLAPQQIADGLADRFRLLTGGSRTALPRQRTLEASVDWSYRLLSEPERTLLDRLSVFAGGFTMASVQAVCADGLLPESSLLDVLTSLVDKSLVQVDAFGSGDAARYRMLETIRHFARQRLADSADPVAVRDRHLRRFVALAEEAGPRIERTHELAALECLDADLDNIRVALDWADQRGEAELMLRIVAALWLFFEVRTGFDEGTSWLNLALALAPDPTPTRARALHGLGELSLFTLDMPVVVKAGEEAVAIGDHLDDPVVRARGVTLLGWAACFRAYRDVGWAADAVREMLPSLDEEEHPWLYADAGTAIALACIEKGDLRAAAVAADIALASARRAGMLVPLQRALYFRGLVHVVAGEVALGLQPLDAAIALADDLDETWWRALCLAASSRAKCLRGDHAGAEADASAAAELGERYGNPFGAAVGTLSLAVSLAGRGEHEAAATSLDAAREPIEQLSMLSFVEAWLAGAAALIAARRGDLAGARARLDAMAEVTMGAPHTRAFVGVYRGWVERLADDDAAAEWAFTDALDAAAAAGAHAEVATALDELAISAGRRGQGERAARLFGAAVAQHEALGMVAAQPVGLPSPEAESDRVREALGDEAFAAEFAAGRAMSADEAVKLALRGRGGRRRPSSGWESLTPTEVEVVRLVTEGLSNPVIAEKLLISRGTVKTHLSHVFTKLGVTSRSELAAEASRRSP